MSEPTSGWRSRLTEPSSAAGFAALLALLVPSVADQAPAIVELGLTHLRHRGLNKAVLSSAYGARGRS